MNNALESSGSDSLPQQDVAADRGADKTDEAITVSYVSPKDRGSSFIPNENDQTVISQRPVAPPEEFYRAMPLAELAAMLEGKHLDHFSVETMIGGGGMGAVFRGHDMRLDRVVAIKVIPASKRDADTLRRFRLEAQAAARLDHPNIARVFYVGEAEQWNYIVFEFIDGINIRDLVEMEGPLSVDDAVFYTRQVAEALQHAHDRAVVHRDVKPSNVLVTANGVAKLVDMGLARDTSLDKSTGDATASGVTLGTFDYISPEQARNPREADVRSDLYSLGCTLFYMLTGNAPFPEGTALQKLLNHGSQPPPDPRGWRDDLSDQLVEVLMKLMAKRPLDRYQKPSELVNDLLILADMENLPRSQGPTTLMLGASVAQRSLLETNLPWMVALAFLLGSTLWLQSFQSLSNGLDLQPLRFESRARGGSATEPANADLPSPGSTSTREANSGMPDSEIANGGAANSRSSNGGLSTPVQSNTNSTNGTSGNGAASNTPSSSPPLGNELLRNAPTSPAGSSSPVGSTSPVETSSLGTGTAERNGLASAQPTQPDSLSATSDRISRSPWTPLVGSETPSEAALMGISDQPAALGPVVPPAPTKVFDLAGAGLPNWDAGLRSGLPRPISPNTSRSNTPATIQGDPGINPQISSPSGTASGSSADDPVSDAKATEVIVVSAARPIGIADALWETSLSQAIQRVLARPNKSIMAGRKSSDKIIEIRGACALQFPVVLDSQGLQIRGDRTSNSVIEIESSLLEGFQGRSAFRLRDATLRLSGLDLRMLGSATNVNQSRIFDVQGDSSLEVENCNIETQTDNPSELYVAHLGGKSESARSVTAPTPNDSAGSTMASFRGCIIRGEASLVGISQPSGAERIGLSFEDVLLASEGRAIDMRAESGESGTEQIVRVFCSRSTFVTRKGFAKMQYTGAGTPRMGINRSSDNCAFWSPMDVPHMSIVGQSAGLLENPNVLLLQGRDNAYDANIRLLCQTANNGITLFDLSFADGQREGWFTERFVERQIRWEKGISPTQPFLRTSLAEFRVAEGMFVPGIPLELLPPLQNE